MLLSGCAMTFAYWNPAFRSQPRLLNPQTGKDLDMTLWYSAEDDRWVALESLTNGGRRLAYRLE